MRNRVRLLSPVFLTVIGVVFLVPFAFILLTAAKTQAEAGERQDRIDRPQRAAVTGGEQQRMNGLGVDELLAPPSAGFQQAVQRMSGRQFGAVPRADHEILFDRRTAVEQGQRTVGRGRGIG